MNHLFKLICTLLCVFILFSTPAKAALVVNAHNNFINFVDPNPGAATNALVIIRYQWGGISIPGDPGSSVDNLLSFDLTPEMTFPPLFYPSPFRLTDGTTLGYQLNQALDMELRIYDMRGNEIFRKFFASATDQGGRTGYNYIPFNQPTEVFNNNLPENMPSGVYFYILLNDGKVLGKGKFALLP
ncbi:hypothetical protein DID80_02100 [Candidatus Marinamargulisbacteria bacterium SCGC AAA071-K20]|nr:hypothetical protein DID80_02100 [Candidatus Marinamargulisbacteria bacterium SCGC AAA071-K20]